MRHGCEIGRFEKPFWVGDEAAGAWLTVVSGEGGREYRYVRAGKRM